MTRLPAPSAHPPLLAVIVLSVGAPPELAGAVQSVLDQDEPLELVVVNSGGGDVGARLPASRADIRVIATDEVLWPGAARNRGIAATTAPFIAFLASDCIAEPGWVAARLRHHRRGAAAVASAVVNGQPDNLAARISHQLTYIRREPTTPPAHAARYGASYARWLFDTYGLFREDLRVGEDTEFRLRLEAADLPLWAPDVRTMHRNPASLPGLLRDRYARGRRQGQYWPGLRKAGLVKRLQAGVEAAEAELGATPAGRPPRAWLWASLLAYELGYRAGRLRKSPIGRTELRALAWMSQGRLQKALTALNSAGARRLARPELTLYAIIASTRRGALDNARALADAAVAKWPDDRSLSILRARLAPPEDPDAALALWDAHLRRFGADHAVLSGRLSVLIASRRFDAARAAADALEHGFPYAAAAAGWARIEIALATCDWTAALTALTAIFDRLQDPAALERKVAILVALGRIADAEAVARTLEGIDLDSYLRAARELARANNAPELLVDLATRHAGRIGADVALLRLYIGALTSAGANGAALSLLDASPLAEAELRPQRVATLLNDGRLADAWAAFRVGSSRVAPYGASIFSALVSAGLVAGDRQGVADLLEQAETSSRPGLVVKAMVQHRRLADIEALGADPPRLLDAAPPELPSDLSTPEPIRLFNDLRLTHPRFHADPSFVLADAIDVAAVIATAADRKTPLSLIRLGDGEGNLLPYSDAHQPFVALDRRATAAAWWGEDGRTVDTAPLQHVLEDAIRDADIVGIPDRHRLISLDRPGLAESIDPAAKNLRGLRAVLDFTRTQVPADRFITSCHVHQSLGAWGLWDLLLPRLAPLSLVTCHEELAAALAARFGAAVADVFLIPPERKHAGRFASQIAGRHYPDRFEQLRGELRGIRPGQVVLVAAGVLGKIYCQWIKAAGGIAIDVGSAADAWVGYYTRSTGENASYAVLPGAIDGLRALARSDPRVASIVG